MHVLLILLTVAAAMVMARLVLGPPPPRRVMSAEVEKAVAEKMRTLGERLRALEEPRPERAPIVVDDAKLEGDWEVPPRVRVFSSRHRKLAGCMAAMHARWSPSGDAVAVQLSAPYQSQTVIFDEQRNVLWFPEGAVDLSFRAAGTELIEVGSIYTRHPPAPPHDGPRFVSPRQSELEWFVARHRWPSRDLIFQTSIRFPTGWAHELVLSPDERRACITFVDQTEAGWLVVDVDRDDDARTHPVLFRRGSNLLGTPVWSTDGRFVVAPVTADFEWWLPEPPRAEGPLRGEAIAAHRAAVDDHRAKGAAGGRVRVGWVWFQDLDDGSVGAHELGLELPAGWGRELDDDAQPQLGPVRFEGERRVVVTLPDGSSRSLGLAE